MRRKVAPPCDEFHDRRPRGPFTAGQPSRVYANTPRTSLGDTGLRKVPRVGVLAYPDHASDKGLFGERPLPPSGWGASSWLCMGMKSWLWACEPIHGHSKPWPFRPFPSSFPDFAPERQGSSARGNAVATPSATGGPVPLTPLRCGSLRGTAVASPGPLVRTAPGDLHQVRV